MRVAGAGSLAQKLDHLFRTVHPAGCGPYTYQEVSQALDSWAPDGQPGLSGSAIQQLRTGTKTNPTMRTIESLARFFGVGPEYFFADGPPPLADPVLQAAVNVPQVRDLAVAAAALSTESRDVVLAMAVRLCELEGLPITLRPTPRRGSGRSR